MGRRFLLLSIVLLLLAIGCSSREEASGTGSGAKPQGALLHAKLALNWVAEPEFGGYFAAREAGFYRDEGLDVEILGGGAGVPVVQMVAGGQADFTIAGADDVLIAKARGVELMALFAAYQTSPAGIMAHTSRTSLADVFSRGKVALEPGLPTGVFMQKKYGFGKVEMVPYDGGIARFLVDEDFSQQCFVTSEPVAARRKGVVPKVFLLADEGYNPYSGMVVARRSAAAKDLDLAARFVRATRRGWQRYLDDPAPANQVMARLNPAMDLATFGEVAEAQRALIETADTRAAGLGTMKRERWEALAKQLVELGLIDKIPNVDEVLVSLPGTGVEPAVRH